jgi:uncharacterized protein YgiB involved in biofilm formation
LKRSVGLRLVLMGTAALATAGCDDTTQPAAVFENIEQCVQVRYSRDFCEREFEKARQLHQSVAPRYAVREDCEAEFGSGRCESRPSSSGSGSSHSGGSRSSGAFYSPPMAGYATAAPDAGGRPASGVETQPVYRTRSDPAFRSATGESFGARPGPTSVSSQAGRAPNASTTTLSRGGFGARAAAVGAGG